MSKITPENIETMPGFGPRQLGPDMRKFRVRYAKLDLDEASDILQLESLETAAIRDSSRIVIVNKDKFTFMQKYFLIITYLEKTDE